MMGQFLLTGIPGWIPFGDGEVMDSSAWDGYGSERERVLNFLDSANVNNVVVMSGDAHFSVTMDLDPDPTDGASYDEATGNGAVAVEFAPPSITRGNLDEMGLGFAEGLLLSITDPINPQHLFKEFLSHGYGILDIRPDSLVAEFWYSDILSPATSESVAGGWVVRNGDNHWQRTPTTSPTDTSTVGIQPPRSLSLSAQLFPNPASEEIVLRYSNAQPGAATLATFDAHGRELRKFTLSLSREGQVRILLQDFAAGSYWLRLESPSGSIALPFNVQ
jgi:alkaline phosphatase D